MAYPAKTGLPCWSLEQVSRVISLTAQTGAASASSFLAAHSPFRQITDVRSSGRTVTEEEVFSDLFSKARGQVQAFVRGEPGTGKSHLIRWLFERCRYEAREQGDLGNRQRIVLVTRGNGSLKDALGQVVDQLGEEFRQHVQTVKGAIDRLSPETARATLLSELALELDTRWVNEHRRPPLSSRLRHLGEALRSNGFGAWMKREGGVIDQVIKRLTATSTVEERETSPSFLAIDFDVPTTAFRPQEVSAQVYNFVAEDLKEEADTRQLVADVLNIALLDAVPALTGLKGSDLHAIFTKIRRQLGPDKQLVVLIEDVSVTGLDQDVVNAFEARDDDALCRMIAVLGITTNAWNSPQMPDNQRQRATHHYEVGGSAVEHWAADAGEVAKFTARYLNAIRSTDEEIRSIAATRFDGDIRESHCKDCPRIAECHASFGRIDFGNGVEVGMFPFSAAAPHFMLQHLADTRYRSQRGLLDRVLLPALDQSFNLFEMAGFPSPKSFAINSPAFPVWTGFAQRYCGGANWSEDRKLRLRFLAQFWVAATTAEDLAAALKPLLKPLGFPNFSALVEAKQTSLASVQKPKTPTQSPPAGSTGSTAENKELNHLLALLDKWQQGADMTEDSKFRDLLGAFLSKSIIWSDHREIPISEKRRLVSGNTFPRIARQKTSPRGSYFFDFPCDPETLALLQGLIMLSRTPTKTWDFPHAEVHKREVSRWLRKHQSLVIQSVQPKTASIARDCLRTAVQALVLAARLRDSKQLSSDRAERVASLFKSVWSPAERPVVLSSELEAIVSDLELKHALLRDFVVQEVGAGQGDAAPKDFVNPLPLLDILTEFEKDFAFQPPPEAAEFGFWSPRFVAVKPLRQGAYSTLVDRIIQEQTAIGDAVQNVNEFVTAAGFSEEAKDDLRARLGKCLESLKELIDLQRGTQHTRGFLEFPNNEFELLWQKKLIQDSSVRNTWSAAMERAAEVSASPNLSDVVAFNPGRLKECRDTLRIVAKHLDLIDAHLQDEEKPPGGSGDSGPKLIAILEDIAKFSESGEQGESDSE